MTVGLGGDWALTQSKYKGQCLPEFVSPATLACQLAQAYEKIGGFIYQRGEVSFTGETLCILISYFVLQ